MKILSKFIILLLVMFLCPFLYSNAEVSKGIVLSGKTYLFKTANKNSKITGLLAENESVKILKSIGNNWFKIITAKNKTGFIMRNNVFSLRAFYKQSWVQENKKIFSKLEYVFYSNRKFIFKMRYKNQQTGKIVKQSVNGIFRIKGRKLILTAQKFNKTLFLFKLSGKNALSPFNFPAGSKVPLTYLFCRN